jgi:tRNA(fMet)-specific endonuclease VapC
MRYLIDTNAVIALARRRSARLVERVLATDEGANRSLGHLSSRALLWCRQQPACFIQSRNDQAAHPGLSDRSFRTVGRICHRRDPCRSCQAGQAIGPFDALIAGQAKARDLTVITNNLREYLRIENLKVEDWTVG